MDFAQITLAKAPADNLSVNNPPDNNAPIPLSLPCGCSRLRRFRFVRMLHSVPFQQSICAQ